jgi:hypothetical protein
MASRVNKAILATFPDDSAADHVPAAEPLGDAGAAADEGDVHDALVDVDDGLVDELGNIDVGAAARLVAHGEESDPDDAPASGGAGDAPPPRRAKRLAAKLAIEQAERGEWGRGHAKR